jgi:transposase
MKQKSRYGKTLAEKVIKDIRSVTRKQYSAEEKIRMVLEGLRGEETTAALCRREGIAESLHYKFACRDQTSILACDSNGLHGNAHAGQKI